MSEHITNGLLGGVAGLITGSALRSNIARFENTPQTTGTPVTTNTSSTISSTTLIIICVVLLLIILALCKSVYNLTESGWQTFFCFIFGGLYLTVATMYYGLAGYKYMIPSTIVM
jgi:hypothetical protein